MQDDYFKDFIVGMIFWILINFSEQFLKNTARRTILTQ